MLPALALPLCLSLPACGSEPPPLDDSTDGSGESGDGDGDTGDGDTGDGDGDPGDGDGDVEGPLVHIHVRANDDMFAHADESAGQTPQDHYYGIRSYTLYRDPDDPNPMLVFDYGADYIEASYVPGQDTIVASVPAVDLQADTFTHARVTVSHVRFRVATTVHAFNLDVDGDLDILHVLGDGTTYDGETHDKGWWRYVFDVGGMNFPLEGQGGGPGVGAPIGAPIEVVDEGGETAFYFAVDLQIEPDVADDVDIVMDFNVDECFRWQDEQGEGYVDGVFDSTEVGTEPVTRAGANDFQVYYE